MQFITKVTVTGADDSIHPYQLIELAEEYPFVEFAILLSRNSMGRPRFPSREWINHLISDCLDRGMNFAGHICGGWVREILKGRWPVHDFLNIDDDLQEFFQRWQINTHAVPHEYSAVLLWEIVRELGNHEQSIIFQHDGVNTEMIESMSDHKNVSALFDLSHGAGILPESWPLPLEIPCGYAGGLSPENVAGQIEKIATVIGERQIWIDAETKLRSPDDQIFDLAKVRAFLEAAKPWVVQVPKA